MLFTRMKYSNLPKIKISSKPFDKLLNQNSKSHNLRTNHQQELKNSTISKKMKISIIPNLKHRCHLKRRRRNRTSIHSPRLKIFKYSEKYKYVIALSYYVIMTIIFIFRMVLNLIEVDIANYTKAGFHSHMLSRY